MPNRTGATRRAEIPTDVLHALNRGELASATLAEGLAVDFAQLARHAFPELTATPLARVDAAVSLGITARMQLLGDLLLEAYGLDGFPAAASHGSDTVRGWAAYMAGRAPGLALHERLGLLRSLADDAHFAVREWAWLAVRPHVALDPVTAIALLSPWALATSPNLRRFASEVTRPRGVWCAHIDLLKREPQHARGLLDTLHADEARYVRDSVANWLNDAFKTRPDWVRDVCGAWRERNEAGTAYVRRRALRTARRG